MRHVSVESGRLCSALAPLPNLASCRTRVSEVRVEVRVDTHKLKKKKLGPLVAHGNTFIENLGNPADKGDGNGGGLPGASLHLPLGAGRQVGAVLVWGSP